jgi:hypothetical protein
VGKHSAISNSINNSSSGSSKSNSSCVAVVAALAVELYACADSDNWLL